MCKKALHLVHCIFPHNLFHVHAVLDFTSLQSGLYNDDDLQYAH